MVVYIKFLDLFAGSNSYGATNNLLSRGHSQAKHRVVLFLTVFVISGFFSELLNLNLRMLRSAC